MGKAKCACMQGGSVEGLQQSVHCGLSAANVEVRKSGVLLLDCKFAQPVNLLEA